MRTDLADQEFLQQLRTRSRDAYNQLYSRYAGPLYGVICSIVRDEPAAGRLLEETFLAIWKDLDDIQGTEQQLFVRLLRLAQARTSEYLTSRDGSNEDHRTAGLLPLLKTKGKHEYPGVY